MNVNRKPCAYLLRVDKKVVPNLPTWEGDAIFLKLLLNDEKRFFSLKLVYEGDKLVENNIVFY